LTSIYDAAVPPSYSLVIPRLGLGIHEFLSASTERTG
jgi:hypothetical protein